MEERTGVERVLVVPDTHVPYHDSKAFSVMLRAARVIEPDTIILLGDFADCYSVSFHDASPGRVANLKTELEAVGEYLGYLEALEATRRVYLFGNHEDRLERYVTRVAPALYDNLRLHELLRLEERGWEWAPYKSGVKIGKVHFTHDTGTTGVNAHRQSGTAYRGSVVIGHTHRMAYEVLGAVDSAPHLSAMLGWLGDAKEVNYLHQVKAAHWVHGFGVGLHDRETGIVHVQPVPIINGKCAVWGKIVS